MLFTSVNKRIFNKIERKKYSMFVKSTYGLINIFVLKSDKVDFTIQTDYQSVKFIFMGKEM